MKRFKRGRSFNRLVSRVASTCNSPGVEELEARTFLNATLTTGISPVHVPTSSSPTTLNLNSYFNDPTAGTATVEIQTPLGNIPLSLFSSQTPKTVTNFEKYITQGEYNNVIVHRSVPGFVIQGGGYTPNGTHITSLGNVPGEPGISNTTGTIAMALSNGPNSGTSEWFINLANNTNLDNTSDGEPFTVFGTVIYGGMQVVNNIAGLPIVNDSAQSGAFNTLPVQSGTNGATVSSEPASNMVTTNTVIVDPLNYGVSTDNNQLVVPSIASDGTLTLTYAAGATGTAHIDVIASDLGGNTATTTFAVTVGGVFTTPGTIGKGAAHIIHFTDPNGVAGTATLAGPGTATLAFGGPGITTATSKAGVETVTGTPQSISIATAGTSAGSALNINGAVTLAGITSDANIGAINASRASVNGGLTIAGTAGTISLAAAVGGNVSVIGTGRALTLRVGSASGEAVSSAGTIASINAGLWTSGQTISAPTINRISVSKEFNARIAATNLGLVTAGSITGSAWAVANKVAGVTAGSITGLNLSAGVIGPITDRGAATNDAITSSGNIGAVSALSMSGTRIEAGVATADTHGLATAFSTNDRISSVVVGRGGFSNSVIDAQTLPHVSLGTVSSTNGGTPFGVASSDIISLIATVDGKRLVLARATSAATVTAALSKANITPNDLTIRIV